MQAMAYIQYSVHSEVAEPSELAECGNQNRRACLMPGGRERDGGVQYQSP